MRLTNNEIRDINKYLEEGKTLPDKYRFMLFGDAREVELIWNGKTNEVTSTVLPFQTIEIVDEPRSEKIAKVQQDIFSVAGRQTGGWTNKLIWGDNKLILSSLKNGPLRQEIEDQGGLKLVYIDPPFDVGADFSTNIEIGEESLTKKPSVLEELAYRDTWGRGADSFIGMIYERLRLLHQLMANDGSIYIHCDSRVSAYLKLILDEVFGAENKRAEIIWKRSSAHNDSKSYGNIHDTIHFYTKSDKSTWNQTYTEYEQDYIDQYYRYKDPDGRKWLSRDCSAPGGRGPRYDWNGHTRNWRYTKEKMQKLHDSSKLFYTENGIPRLKQYLDEMHGVPSQTLWTDKKVQAINSWHQEDASYPTQKPEALIERLMLASSNEGDLVGDFFMGSGTTLAVAEKLGRKWIGSDMGKFSIHTARKRMINVQRQLKNENKNYRAFEILNLGRYERQHYVGVNANLRDEEREAVIAKKEREFVALITKAYKAEPVQGFKTFHAKRAARLVAIGPINLPVSSLLIDSIVNEAIEKGITKVDVLGFEFEMGLSPAAQDEAKGKGVDIALKYIPKDVFDKRAIEKEQVVFHDVSYIEVKPLIKGKTIAIELTDFSVFYSQANLDQLSAELKPGGSKVEVIDGQIYKISKEKESGIVHRDQLTKSWTDWVDYWSVDFNFESRKEIIRKAKTIPEQVNLNGETDENKLDLEQYEEIWTGDYVFENEWQSFRTRKDRKIELVSVYNEYVGKGRYKIAVKVVDIFGNDTTKVIEVSL